MPRATPVPADRVGADQREADRHSTTGTGERELDSDAAFQIRTAGQVGPTGRPLPDFPEPPAPDLARPGAHHRDVQPEGWRRQDDDHDQPRRGAGRGRPPGAARRLRPAGRAVGGPRASPTNELDVTVYNLLIERGHDIRDVIQHTKVEGLDVLPGQHRPVRRRGAARRRGRPRADPRPRAAPGRRRLRRRAHRLPALARPAHRQRPDRRARRDHPARVRVLRDARRRPARRDDREDHRPAEPAPAGRRHPRDDVRRAHPALARGRGAASSSTSATTSSTPSSRAP